MAGKVDEVKGRVKKAAGKATGRRKLQAKGQVQVAKGKVKQAATKAKKKVKRATR
jgi:uncharacterized protein YjbJ (UPF0337 family)